LGVIMNCGLILGNSSLGRALFWARSGCRVNTVPAVTLAAALTKFRLEELALHVLNSLIYALPLNVAR
jgi:hypothetical protein